MPLDEDTWTAKHMHDVVEAFAEEARLLRGAIVYNIFSGKTGMSDSFAMNYFNKWNETACGPPLTEQEN